MKRGLPEVLERMKKIGRIKTQRDLAVALKISPQDLSKRLKRGTWRSLYPNIIRWAIETRVSLDWLFKEKSQQIQLSNTILARIRTAKERFEEKKIRKNSFYNA